MEKSMFEMKVKEAIKPIEEICEMLTTCTKAELSKGSENADTKEVGEVVDMIKDLCEAKHFVVDAMYKIVIATAMEENADTYGEEWDEEGLKHYRRRDSKGRFMYSPRIPETYRPMMYYREMDGNRMHTGIDEGMTRNYEAGDYTGMGNNMTNSRYENSRRNYTENKKMRNGNTETENNQNAMDVGRIFDIIKEDLKELLPDMKQAEKNTARAKTSEILNMF